MKHFILIFTILSILTLSGCSVKNSAKNDLHNNQTCYYQDDNLTKYEQNTIYEENDGVCLSEQAREVKQNEPTTIKLIGWFLGSILEVAIFISYFI
jgi:hypothetical protein